MSNICKNMFIITHINKTSLPLTKRFVENALRVVTRVCYGYVTEACSPGIFFKKYAIGCILK